MTQKKISNYIRFFVLLLPIFAILGAIFRNGDIQSILSYIETYFDLRPAIFDNFLNYFTVLGFDSYAFVFAYDYLIYVFCVEFTLLLFDFILFIPRWIRGLIFSYEKKNKN